MVLFWVFVNIFVSASLILIASFKKEEFYPQRRDKTFHYDKHGHNLMVE